MIDTDKYEGHSEDRVWKQYSTGLTSDYVYYWNDADENLVRDAPLLLAEVKRLRAIIEKAEMACLETDPTEGGAGNLKRILEIFVGEKE